MTRTSDPPTLGAAPRAQIAHLPLAALGAAGLALQPRLAAVLDVAGEKIAAGDAVLLVGRGERRDRATGAGLRVLPRQAGMRATFGQDLARRGARNGEVALGRRLRSRLGHGQPERSGRVGPALVLFRKHVVELIGEAATAARERQREQARSGGQAGQPRVPSTWPSSITGLSRRRTWHQREDTPRHVWIRFHRTPDLVNEW